MAARPMGRSGVLPPCRLESITWNAFKTPVLVLNPRPTKTESLEVWPRHGVCLKSCTGDFNVQTGRRTTTQPLSPQESGARKDEGVSVPQVAQTSKIALRISHLSLAAKAGLSASGAGVERSHVCYLLFSYLLVEEVFDEEAPEVDEGNTAAAAFQFSQFLGIVL